MAPVVVAEEKKEEGGGGGEGGGGKGGERVKGWWQMFVDVVLIMPISDDDTGQHSKFILKIPYVPLLGLGGHDS